MSKLISRSLPLALVFLATLGSAQAISLTPEPSTYAVGFGAAVIGFVVWRNFRKSRKQDKR